MQRFLTSALFGVILISGTMTPTALRADDRKYHDSEHNDEHAWNSHEEKAYKSWAKENHRKYVNFSKLRQEDQRAYWNWRHNHPDADMKHR
jgi:hypothetical protein